MIDFSNPEKASRVLVNLIWCWSSQFLVWEPSIDAVRVGDYGTLNPQTGQFIREGNTFDSKEETLVEWAKKHSTRGTGATSERVYGRVNGLEVSLIIHEPRYTALPRDLDIAPLLCSDTLRGKILVTKVTECFAYTLLLSSKKDLKFSFVRKAEVSDSLNPLGSSGGSTQNKEPNSEGGTCHIGADRNAFTALYEAKMCMGRRRIIYRPGGNPEETGIDRLEQAMLPWDSLNDDGDEEKLNFSL